MLADRELRRLEEEMEDLVVERVDVVTSPLRAWREGIRFFPALRSGTRTISGVLLSREQIKAFIDLSDEQPDT